MLHEMEELEVTWYNVNVLGGRLMSAVYIMNIGLFFSELVLSKSNHTVTHNIMFLHVAQLALTLF